MSDMRSMRETEGGGGQLCREGDHELERQKQQQHEAVEEEAAVELRVEPDDPDFDLEKAVCSHGLFMMAPNRWDPTTRTFHRPLRPSPSLSSSSSSYPLLSVRISQPTRRPALLLVSVSGTRSLSADDQRALLAQVRRMLRLSAEDGRVVREFHELHPVAKERGFGRVFRSPTLFEDMVKCILLCNCQWPRTLSMARALCELQLELKSYSTAEDFHPRTPQSIELKSKHTAKEKVVVNLESKFKKDAELETPAKSGNHHNNDHDSLPKHPKRRKPDTSILSSLECSINGSNTCQFSDFKAQKIHQGGTISHPSNQVGDFPSPEELAGLEENFLAKRCGLGYRAKRLLLLAQSFLENKIQLREFEDLSDMSNPSSYDKLAQQLSELHGFGPFTCANVLMCMGFYHKIPSDSETLRHLKEYYPGRCTIQNVQKYAECIYEKYAPFQFLAYWCELWNSYEKKFGILSEVPQSEYQLITASNMKTKAKKKQVSKLSKMEGGI